MFILLYITLLPYYKARKQALHIVQKQQGRNEQLRIHYAPAASLCAILITA